MSAANDLDDDRQRLVGPEDLDENNDVEEDEGVLGSQQPRVVPQRRAWLGHMLALWNGHGDRGGGNGDSSNNDHRSASPSRRENEGDGANNNERDNVRLHEVSAEEIEMYGNVDRDGGADGQEADDGGSFFPRIYPTDVAKSPVALYGDTIALVPSDGNTSTNDDEKLHLHYSFRFQYDATVDCLATVYVLAQEHVSESRGVSYRTTVPQRTPVCAAPIALPSGVKQWFGDVPDGRAHLDLNEFPLDELRHLDASSDVYPVVIRLAVDESLRTSKSVTAQMVYCRAERDEGSPTIRLVPVRKMLEYNNHLYEAQEIFGDKTEDDEDLYGYECVVCITDPRTCAVLPCRHLCLCKDCADLLRRQTQKCPICRAPVRSLIHMPDRSSVTPRGDNPTTLAATTISTTASSTSASATVDE